MRRKVDIEALKSLRLTCRRLCETASPYLVPTVTVHVTRMSIYRLNAISRHASIGRRVRCIRIALGSRERTLSDGAQRTELPTKIRSRKGCVKGKPLDEAKE
ncbi:hypothetical protein BDP55DRAFT_681570 [Colletotrichum godetiae]|uniref:Uncharacterized protein n=1 Tax=Colletotrichum godetiae TaxID=1209918 RepID=A0AAJ0ABU8_9PEZI|nr:uncharacterized protein BDP55DRAFT_681570 [Colletotrichum godetiae]KAK1658721.1 hypothetical protein BDP55DRAFT_681570 [Colletotrichum godetiae]